jgi:hypothetical protein
MTEVFSKHTKKWDFSAIVPDILRTTQLPLPVKTAKNSLKTNALSTFYAKPRHDASYWAAKTVGFDFSREDRVDAPTYNLVLWKGLVGENVPYPTSRDARDLSKNRSTLLKRWREARFLSFSQQQATATTQSGGGK